jgi:hypothetical protein
VFSVFLLRVSAAPIIDRMGFLSYRQLAVAAFWCGFRTLLVQVAATAPQTTGRLLAVYPNVAELLAVMALP